MGAGVKGAGGCWSSSSWGEFGWSLVTEISAKGRGGGRGEGSSRSLGPLVLDGVRVETGSREIGSASSREKVKVLK